MTTKREQEPQSPDRETRPQIVLVNRCVVIEPDRKILIIQRHANDPWKPGEWELPGGKLDEGQSISDALEREVLEETGLFVIPITRLAFYDSRMLTSGKYSGLPHIELVGIGRTESTTVRLSQEHQDSKWVTLDEAFDENLSLETRKALAALATQLQQYLS